MELTEERRAEPEGVIQAAHERLPQQSSLTPDRQAGPLAYCKLSELEDDPEVQTLIPVLYDAAVGYMENAGVAAPELGTARRAQYDLCVNYLVLDAWERRDVSIVGTTVSENQAFRQTLNQLKLTEGGGYG